MMWWSFPSYEDFETWHDAMCLLNGIPKPGRNAETGELDPTAQWTVAYASPIIVDAEDVRVWLNTGDLSAQEYGAVASVEPS